MKKNKTSKQWLSKKHRDLYFKQSKIEGYRSRSAYKLLEMDKKFNFIKKKTLLLDLGSSPGGWTQVASKKITEGKILSVDINFMKEVRNTHFLKGDLLDPNIDKNIFSYFGKKIDVVVSDMAANTSGNKDLDSFKTGELCLRAMDIAKNILNNEGVFLSKLFMGSIFSEINGKANKCFKKVIKYKPKSSRKESREIYIYCKGI